MNLSNYKICVIGLGYVGLPLARLFSTKIVKLIQSYIGVVNKMV